MNDPTTRLLEKPDGPTYTYCAISVIKVTTDDQHVPSRGEHDLFCRLVTRAMEGHRMRPLAKVASEIEAWLDHHVPGRFVIAYALLDPRGPWGLLYTWPLRPELPHYVWWRHARYQRLSSGALKYLSPCPWEKSS